MTLELRKFHLIEMIMKVSDERVLAKYEELLRETPIEEYESSLKPMTQEELRQRALAAEEDIKAGRFMELEDLEEEMKNW